MREHDREIFEAAVVPERWMAAIWIFILGTLAAVLGSAALAPSGYPKLGNALLWGGTVIMFSGFGVAMAVFLRLWRPPGITEREW